MTEDKRRRTDQLSSSSVARPPSPPSMNELRQRTLTAIIKNAVLSPASGLIIAAGMLLTVGVEVLLPSLTIGSLKLSPEFFNQTAPAIRAVFPYLLGVLGAAWLGVVGVGIVNPKAGQQVASQMFREQFDISRISDSNLKVRIAQAMAYRERIDKSTDKFPDRASRGRVEDVANQIEEWVRRIYTLAVRLDTYKKDSIIRTDLQTVPDAIRDLRKRLAVETDSDVHQEIQDTLNRRQTQLSNLQKLDNTMDRADLQLENTLTALGTVYSQVLLIDAGDVSSSKTQRLRENILEQVNSLQDVITSMDEVYNAQDPVDVAMKNLSTR